MSLGNVIALVSELESLLRALGGVGRGLGELARSLDDDLSVTLRDRLRGVNGVRNRIVHQNAELTETEASEFLQELQELKEELDALVLERSPGPAAALLPEERAGLSRKVGAGETDPLPRFSPPNAHLLPPLRPARSRPVPFAPPVVALLCAVPIGLALLAYGREGTPWALSAAALSAGWGLLASGAPRPRALLGTGVLTLVILALWGLPWHLPAF